MDAKNTAAEILGYPGRLLGSKGQYRWDHKNHLVLFNSNVCTSQGKVWHGDLDITLDEEKVMKLAQALQETVYVLYESDARFENEKNPRLDQAVYSVDPSGKETYSTDYYSRSENGRLYSLDAPEPTAEELEERKRTYLASDLCAQHLYEKTNVKISWAGVKRLSSKKSPLHKFWESLVEPFDLGKKNDEEKRDFFQKVKITAKDHKILHDAMVAWINKYHDYLSDYRKSSELNWALFLSGPSHFSYDPDWIEPGYVYIEKPEA